jgi:hypothetical protein
MRARTPLRVETQMVATAAEHTPDPPPAGAPRPARLSERDARLVAALTAPTPEGDALLAGFDPAEYADWLDRPEVRRALAAAQALRGLRLRAKAAQRAERAMDRLDAVLDHAADLKDDAQRTETRRAASVLARISTQCLAWMDHATTDRATGFAALGDTRAASAPSPSHRITVSPPRVSPTSLPPQPRPPLPRLVKYAPGPAVASQLALLRAMEQPTHTSLAKALDLFIDPCLGRQCSPGHDRFMDDLMASPAITARHRPFRAEPVRVEGGVATQRVVFTLEDGREAACLFRLVQRPWSQEPGSPPVWLTDSIRPEDSS